MQTPPPLDASAVAALLRSQAACIRGEINGLPAEACRWRPAEGEWSINEALGHLLESERRGFAGRIRTILEHDNPALGGWDQEDVAEARHDEMKDPAGLLQEFEAMRAASIALVEGLTPQQLARRGQHVQVGEVSVQDLLHEWVHHDRNHVKQILSVVQEYVWPNMGNCRRFADFD